MAGGCLWRDCRTKLAGLRIPRPFSVEALCAQVSRDRGRRVHVHPLPYVSAPDMPCGVWVATAEADHIFHARGASALHQQNIILHEIGHMICDHSVREPAGSGLAALLVDLDPAMVRRVLLRTRYSSYQEKEAEMMAALISQEAGLAPADPHLDGSLARIRDVFGLSEGRGNV